MTINFKPSLSSGIAGVRGSSPIPTATLDMKTLDEFGDTVINRPSEGGLPHKSSAPSVIRIGLLDSFFWTRGCCLIEALATLEHGFAVTAFETTTDLIASGVREIDVIIYHEHEPTPSCVLGPLSDSTQEELANVPIIVLSDAMTALEPQTVRAGLKCGVRGFISTRTFEMKTLSAAIRFVAAGGIAAPVDLLLADERKPFHARDETEPPAGLLTPREMTVLPLLQQGKANKIIAYELGMSEHTVKVHVHNIMRKTGATNRTQAIYKLQQLSHDRAFGVCAGL